MKNALVFLLGVALVLASLPAPAAFGGDDPFAWKWYELDDRGQLQLNLFIFYRSTCPHCRDAIAFARRLQEQHPWLNVYRYEVSSHAGNIELYRRMSASVGRSTGQVPALFYCKQLTTGYVSDRSTGRRIEANLINCREQLLKQLQQKRSGDGAALHPREGDLFRALFAGAPRGATMPVTVCCLTAAMQVPDSSIRSEAPSPEAAPPDARSSRPQSNEPQSSKSQLSKSKSSHPESREPESTGPLAPRSESPDLEALDLKLPPPLPEEETVPVPFFGEQRASDMSLPALTLVIAGCDAFNPCAFFVLLSLLSLLMHAHSRAKITLVGGIFVFFSGLFYFLFMAAWLNVFLLAGHLTAITVTAGVLAIVVSAMNIKDFFALKRGVSLSIPESAKPGLFARMRKLPEATRLAPMLVGTLALALAANSYELLCTAGFPMVFTRILTLRELSTGGYYSYLLLYNLIYVVPLAAIVIGFTVTLGSHKLQEREGRVLKLLSGVMMAMLGAVILFAPDLLQSALASLAILLGAVALTAIVVLFDTMLRRLAHHDGSRVDRSIHGKHQRAGRA